MRVRATETVVFVGSEALVRSRDYEDIRALREKLGETPDLERIAKVLVALAGRPKQKSGKPALSGWLTEVPKQYEVAP